VTLFHIIAVNDWRAAQDSGELAPQSLTLEGFVHFSHAHQVAGVANNRYRDLDNLLVLEVDSGAVAAPVVEEDSYGSGQQFPHIYSAIPVFAVVAEHRLGRDAAGEYTFQA